MIRSLGILLVAALGAGGAIALVHDRHAALVTLPLLLASGAVALTVAHLSVRQRRRLGSLGRQFDLAVGLAVGQFVVVVAGIAALMLVSDEVALQIAAIALFAGVVAVRAAQLFAGGVLRDVESLRDGLVAVGEGERETVILTAGADELSELAAQANATVARLAVEESRRDDIEAARRNLVATVSHDLRTPITSLRLLADAVGDDIVGPQERRRYLGSMTTHIDALAALIDDLFELSRLEAGDISWSVERVRLDELVREIVSAMRPQADERRVDVRAELGRPLVAARANPEKLQRVLFNLIQNAIRHTPADGSVTVRAHDAGAEVEIEIADTGEGIAPVDRPHVFDAFFRGGTERSRTRSSAGLGLAISRAIVEAHGGTIWLDPADAGTVVRFRLPAAD